MFQPVYQLKYKLLLSFVEGEGKQKMVVLGSLSVERNSFTGVCVWSSDGNLQHWNIYSDATKM